MSSVRVDIRRLQQLGRQLARPVYAKVGILQGSGRASTGNLSMVELAAIHEFGSPAARVPERSFIRSTFRDRARIAALQRISGQLSRLVLTQKTTLPRAIALIGQWGSAEVRKQITVGPGIPPPLSPVTIARKGSSRPLVDKGQLVNSITYQVVEGEP